MNREIIDPEDGADLLLLAGGLLEDIELERRRMSSVVRRCLRLSRLMEDREAFLWFGLELDGFSKENLPSEGTEIGFDRLLLKSARVFTREEGETHQKRAYLNKLPLVELEEKIRELKEELSQTRYPPGLFYPTEYAPQVEKALARVDQERLRLSRQLTEYLLVYERIKGKVHNWVLGAWTSLSLSHIPSNFLSHLQRIVESDLKELCPTAISQLTSKYKELKRGRGDWRDLVVACGQLLRAFTDAVYPFQGGVIEGSDGLKREITPEQYFLRLIGFLTERMEEGPRRNLLLSQMNHLEERLRTFLTLPPHPDEDDANLCLIQAYLLLGELLKTIR